MEFRIWAELIEQSRGGLHVFLPLLDRGLDAVVHRMSDDNYIALQVKSRGELHGTKLQIVIPNDKLVDDAAIIVAGTLIDGQLGSVVIVVDEGTFKRLARSLVFEGQPYFWIEVDLDAPPDDWRPYVAPTSQLAARLMGAPPGEAMRVDEVEAEAVDRSRQWLGFVGEAEVIRQLSLNPVLDLFRPFPDVEFVEVLARHNLKQGFCGLQVKTGTIEESESGGAICRIRKATMVVDPRSYVVALAWQPDLRCLADEILLIPSAALAGVAQDDGDAWVITLHPHSRKSSKVDPYRLPLAGLAARVEAIASGEV